ncbi:MAG: KH domain-containing protein [Leptospirales bacterium]
MEATVESADPVGLVEYVAKCLVKNVEDVQVISVPSPSSLIIELHVNNTDLGAIIGKGGRIARAMRTLLGSISLKKIVLPDHPDSSIGKIVLEIIDQ